MVEQSLEEEINLRDIEKKAKYRLELIDEGDNINERKIRIRKKLKTRNI